MGVAGPTGVGDDDKTAGDRSDPLAPLVSVPPPPHPATAPTKSTDAIAHNILVGIGYFLDDRGRHRITASQSVRGCGLRQTRVSLKDCTSQDLRLGSS